jgi:hypothetical protein
MPRVIVQRPLRWDTVTYPAGVAVDMPDEILTSLPSGTVRMMDSPATYQVMPPPAPPEPRQAAASVIGSAPPKPIAPPKPATATPEKK